MAKYCAKCDKKLTLLAGIGGYLGEEPICYACNEELGKIAVRDRTMRRVRGHWRYFTEDEIAKIKLRDAGKNEHESSDMGGLQ